MSHSVCQPQIVCHIGTEMGQVGHTEGPSTVP